MKVKIKGVSYSVFVVKTLVGSSGLINTLDKSIYLEETSDLEEFRKTIIHELIHAYFIECGLINYGQSETLVIWLERHFDEIYLQTQELFNRLNDFGGKNGIE